MCSCVCVGTHKCSSCECQKGVSDPMKRWLWATWCGCWELNSSPVQEQPVISTAESHLQPLGWEAQIFILLLFVCDHVPVHVSTGIWEGWVSSLRAEIQGNCEPQNLGWETIWTWVLCRDSKLSLLMTHLFCITHILLFLKNNNAFHL